MIKLNGNYLDVNSSYLSNKRVYSDRNGVYSGLSLPEGIISSIRFTLNQLNTVVNGGLKIISNESEFSVSQVIEEDNRNGINISPNNYKLSTLSSAKFLIDVIGTTSCYFIGNENIEEDLRSMGVKNPIKITDSTQFTPNIPLIFAKTDFAAKSMFSSDEEIEKNIYYDQQFSNLIGLLKKGRPKIIFCHTKPNCDRLRNGFKFRELHLGFYFKFLMDNFGYKVGEDLFDLGKGDYSNGEFFDISLGINDRDYSHVVGIGDVHTDIEYVLKQGGTGILVNSGDGINNDEVLSRLGQYSGRFYNIMDLSHLKLI